MTTPRIDEIVEEFEHKFMSVDEWLRQALTKAHQAGIEKGRVSVLEDFDCLMKADGFIGFTNDEWKAVQKFFRYNDEISGWKDDTIKALQDNK